MRLLLPFLFAFSSLFGQELSFIRRPKLTDQSTTINGSTKIAAFMPSNPFFTFTCVKSNGKFYFGAMGLEGQLRNPFMYRYDPVTNIADQETEINVSGVVTYDIHRVPTVSQDSRGNIWMVAEELQTPGNGGHSSPLRVYKTGTPGDMTTLALVNTIPNRYAYPHLFIDKNDNIYIFARGTNSNTFIRGQYWMHKSVNNGATFTSTKIYDSGDEQKVAYFQRIHDYSDNLYLILNERDNDNFNYTYAAPIKSTDGGTTWTNIPGTFSKNVVSVGALTRSDMRTNCLLYETPTPLLNAVNYEGGVVKSDGTVKLLISLQTPTGVDVPTTGVEEVVLDELRFYVYSAGWTYENVSIPSNMTFYWAADKPTRYVNGNKGYDDVIVIDVATRNVYMKRSYDNFNTTYSSRLLLNGSGHNYRMGDIAFNATNEDDYVFIIADPIGDPLLWQNESTTNYTNLVIFRPGN